MSLGWKNPQNTDANSTNCLLNTLGNYVHLKRYGFNPYVQEISELVRLNIIMREEALARLEKNLDTSVIDGCVSKLKLDRNWIEGI
jgi:hypothetical protein